ncbi:MAG: hypothetical protein ACLT75_02360 [Alistipes putredinis]
MKSNPYADLRIDNRADLPAPWYDYPVLQSGEYRTEILYTSGRDYVKVHIGQQDGAWVAATTWMIGGSGRGCHRPEMGRVRLGTERSAVGVRRIAGRRGRAASGRDQDRKSTHFRDQTIQTVLTMDDQLYFEQCLLASLERFGFTIDRQLKMARGIAYFATLHPAFSVQIGFELCLDGIRFTVTLHSLSFMKGFPYRHLMRYPPKADIIIPMILRAIFNYLGDELARNFRNQINS